MNNRFEAKAVASGQSGNNCEILTFFNTVRFLSSAVFFLWLLNLTISQFVFTAVNFMSDINIFASERLV